MKGEVSASQFLRPYSGQ